MLSTRPPLAAGLLAVGSLLAVGAMLTGCASFPDQPPPPSWTEPIPLTPQGGPAPQGPSGSGGGGGNERQQAPSSIPPPDGCTDFHPTVIATCLADLTAVAAIPGTEADPVGLVAERLTGRILLVQKDKPPVLVAALPVDTATPDGGLTGLALSPNYLEDQLIFAYLTTPMDNRLVRIAAGDAPKPVLTGIPRGPSGNRGTLALDHRGALLLATGDAGNPAIAADPASLAGKLLRLDSGGRAATGNPTATSPVVATGVRSPGGVCASLDGSRIWLTDRLPGQDVLYRVTFGSALGAPAWSWPERPGVTGCASVSTAVSVVTGVAGDMRQLQVAPDGTITGSPQVSLTAPDGFGRYGGLDLLTERVALAGTINKDASVGGAAPVSSDDRAVLIVVAGGAGGGGPD